MYGAQIRGVDSHHEGKKTNAVANGIEISNPKNLHVFVEVRAPRTVEFASRGA